MTFAGKLDFIPKQKTFSFYDYESGAYLDCKASILNGCQSVEEATAILKEEFRVQKIDLLPDAQKYLDKKFSSKT